MSLMTLFIHTIFCSVNVRTLLLGTLDITIEIIECLTYWRGALKPRENHYGHNGSYRQHSVSVLIEIKRNLYKK